MRSAAEPYRSRTHDLSLFDLGQCFSGMMKQWDDSVKTGARHSAFGAQLNQSPNPKMGSIGRRVRRLAVGVLPTRVEEVCVCSNDLSKSC